MSQLAEAYSIGVIVVVPASSVVATNRPPGKVTPSRLAGLPPAQVYVKEPWYDSPLPSLLSALTLVPSAR